MFCYGIFGRVPGNKFENLVCIKVFFIKMSIYLYFPTVFIKQKSHTLLWTSAYQSKTGITSINRIPIYRISQYIEVFSFSLRFYITRLHCTWNFSVYRIAVYTVRLWPGHIEVFQLLQYVSTAPKTCKYLVLYLIGLAKKGGSVWIANHVKSNAGRDFTLLRLRVRSYFFVWRIMEIL